MSYTVGQFAEVNKVHTLTKILNTKCHTKFSKCHTKWSKGHTEFWKCYTKLANWNTEIHFMLNLYRKMDILGFIWLILVENFNISSININYHWKLSFFSNWVFNSHTVGLKMDIFSKTHTLLVWKWIFCLKLIHCLLENLCQLLHSRT